jgi:hypothetical protein
VRLRYTPAYVDAVRRLAGKPPARTSALIQRGTVRLIARPASN